jgi:L-fuculose-phosphate aldolase
MRELQSLKESLCEVGRRLYASGLVVARQGNLSVRVGPAEFLCTPTGYSKGRLEADDICLINAGGEVIGGRHQRSTEVLLHLEIYRQCPQAQAIVHSHPPHALAFAVTHRALPRNILPEVEVQLGEVPLVPYATPGTSSLSNSVIPFVQRAHTMLLANHGVVSYGDQLEQALLRTEILEHYCRVLLLAGSLGPPRSLTAAQLKGLEI